MKQTRLMLLAIVLLLVPIRDFAQNKPDRVIDTTLCDVVQAPEQFVGERVRIRARLWWHDRTIWMNEAGSLQIGKVCAWLPADFGHATSLFGSTAIGTFTGRLIWVPTRSKFGALSPCLRFEVEQESDVHDRIVLNGLVMPPQLYDQSSRTFVRPGACLTIDGSAQDPD